MTKNNKSHFLTSPTAQQIAMSLFHMLIVVIIVTLFALSGALTQAQNDMSFEQAENGFSDYSYFLEGFSQMHDGQFEDAIAWFDLAIEAIPDHASAYAFRAAAYYELGAYETAILDFDVAIELSPTYESAYRWRGDAYAAIGEDELAEQDWAMAAELIAQDA